MNHVLTVNSKTLAAPSKKPIELAGMATLQTIGAADFASWGNYTATTTHVDVSVVSHLDGQKSVEGGVTIVAIARVGPQPGNYLKMGNKAPDAPWLWSALGAWEVPVRGFIRMNCPRGDLAFGLYTGSGFKVVKGDAVDLSLFAQGA